jgi:CBS domain-containing protein
MTIAELMTTTVATCRTTDSLNRAAQLMWERRCGCVPVLDERDRVVGILTDRDVSMAAYTQGRRIDDIPVKVAMSHPVWTCAPSDSIEEAEDLMMAHAVRRLVVVEDGMVRGLVSISDIATGGSAWDRKVDIDLERVALTMGEISRRATSLDDDDRLDPTSETDVFDLVQNSLAALRTLRDEIRVDLNLAGKEVRDRWRRLETRLRAAEMRARATRSEGAQDLATLVETAHSFRARVREEVASQSRGR